MFSEDRHPVTRLADIWNVKVCRARFSSRGLRDAQLPATEFDLAEVQSMMSWCARPQIAWQEEYYFEGNGMEWVIEDLTSFFWIFRLRERLGPTKFFPYIQPEQAAVHGMGRGHRGTLNRMRWVEHFHRHLYFHHVWIPMVGCLTTIKYNIYIIPPFDGGTRGVSCLDVKGSMLPHCSCETESIFNPPQSAWHRIRTTAWTAAQDKMIEWSSLQDIIPILYLILWPLWYWTILPKQNCRFSMIINGKSPLLDFLPTCTS